MAPPFGGFFKRDKGKGKDKDRNDDNSEANISKRDQNLENGGDEGTTTGRQPIENNNAVDDAAAQQQAPPTSAADLLTISDLQKLLEENESQRIATLCSKLESIRNSVIVSLQSLSGIADDMDQEKIKLEDLEVRFRSVVENSKRTVVSSVKRESSSELPELRSINDVRKFKERLESMMNRFGEVSGSHSKVLNMFIKKRANKMKDEFETLTTLLKDTKTLISDYDKEREPAVRCANLINTIQQKSNSTRSIHASIESTNTGISDLQKELDSLRQQVMQIESSDKYATAVDLVNNLKDVEKEQEDFRKEITDMFTHVSRAITKYSYGTGKETLTRLYTLGEEPWRIFESDDISLYSSLLGEIQKAIESDRVQLKDKDKVRQYLGDIISSLPQLKDRSDNIRSRKKSLSEDRSRELVMRNEKLKQSITQYEEEIDRNKQTMEQAKAEEQEKSNDIANLLKQTESSVYEVLQKNYQIVVDNGDNRT